MSDKIKQLKEKVGVQAELMIANGLGLQRVGVKYRCPNTYAHKNGDKNPSLSWDSKALQFYCFTCGMQIDVYGYYRDHLNYSHGEVVSEILGTEDIKSSRMQSSRDSFVKQITELLPLTDACIKYIESRGITQESMDHFQLKSFRGAIAFPYYKYGTVVGYKTREPKKNPEGSKMKSISGSKPYLFNAQSVEPGGPELVICEGEFDCMVIWQSGIKNVVSVGAGANSLGAMIDQAKEYLNSFGSLIIVSDNDDAGSRMDKAFVDTFGDKVKLIDKKMYSKNDVNEELFKHGASRVVEIVESARLRIEGRRDLERNPYRGLEARVGKYIPTGLPSLDMAMNDLAPACTTLITGRSNGGKTTLVKQIIAKAIDEGSKVYLMNGENDSEMLLNELYQTVIGRDSSLYSMVKVNKKFRKEPKPGILKKLQEWHRRKLFMFNKGESKLKTLEGLLAMVESEIKYNQYDLVVIDNLMSILSVSSADKNEKQADFMQGLCDMAKNYSTHIALVLHPNKTYGKGQDMDFEQISGSSDLYNKADNIIAVIREYDPIAIEEGRHGRVGLIKNRYYGELVNINVFYDKESGLLCEGGISGAEEYSFNWSGDKIVNQIGMTEVPTPEDLPF